MTGRERVSLSELWVLVDTEAPAQNRAGSDSKPTILDYVLATAIHRGATVCTTGRTPQINLAARQLRLHVDTSELRTATGKTGPVLIELSHAERHHLRAAGLNETKRHIAHLLQDRPLLLIGIHIADGPRWRWATDQACAVQAVEKFGSLVK